MPVKTYYLKDAAASGSNFLSLQDGGSAPASATTATGWVQNSLGQFLASLMERGVKRAAGTFSGSLPSTQPDDALGDAFRSENSLNGTFDAGVWTFKVGVIAVDQGGSSGSILVRLWKSANPDGSGAINYFTNWMKVEEYINITTGTQYNIVSSGLSVPAITFSNEYLFLQVSCYTDLYNGSGKPANSDVLLRVGGTNCQVETSNFTTASGPTNLESNTYQSHVRLQEPVLEVGAGLGFSALRGLSQLIPLAINPVADVILSPLTVLLSNPRLAPPPAANIELPSLTTSIRFSNPLLQTTSLIKLYFRDEYSDGSNYLRMIDGLPPTAETISTGWEVGGLEENKYCQMQAKFERPATDFFNDSIMPAPMPEIGNGFRTAPLNGTIAPGPIQFQIELMAITAGGDQDLELNIAFYKLADDEIFNPYTGILFGSGGTSTASDVNTTTPRLVVFSGTVPPSGETFHFQRLYVIINCRTRPPHNGGINPNNDVHLRIGPESFLLTPPISEESEILLSPIQVQTRFLGVQPPVISADLQLNTIPVEHKIRNPQVVEGGGTFIWAPMPIDTPLILSATTGGGAVQVSSGNLSVTPKLYFPLPIDGDIPTTDYMGNIRAGIKPYGFGLFYSAPILTGVAIGTSASIFAGVASPAIDPPLFPLAVHMGQGAVFLSWGHDTPELVSYYELVAAATLAGPYVKYLNGEFQSRHGMIRNIPIGATAYFQLRAVGVNGAVSDWVQVKKGKFNNSTLVSLKVRAIEGSRILQGAIFTDTDQETGLILAMQANELITIQ